LETAMPTPKSYHCSVQINDCEIAIIGGDNNTRAIEIYNYKENTWRSGPELDLDPMPTPSHDYQVACGKILDINSYHTYVVIGGLDDEGSLRLWDIQTNVVVLDDDTDLLKCKRYHSLDENTLILANCENNEVQTYRVDVGVQCLYCPGDAYGHSTGDSFLAPRRTTTCWEHL